MGEYDARIPEFGVMYCGGFAGNSPLRKEISFGRKSMSMEAMLCLLVVFYRVFISSWGGWYSRGISLQIRHCEKYFVRQMQDSCEVA